MNKEDNNSNINNKKKLTLKEKLKDKREKAKLELILYGIFFLGLIIFLRIGNMRSTHNEVNNNDNIFISQITDNYEYNINITINDIVYNYTGKVLGYNEVITNNNNNEHYYKKKDIYYKLDSDKGYILTNKKDIYNIIDYDYLDINNIKEYIKLSTREDNIYKVKVSDIRDTNYDPLAKALRKYVKDEKIRGKVPVVFSSEEPKKNDKNLVSSMMMVPATAGINAAYYVINDIIK